MTTPAPPGKTTLLHLPLEKLGAGISRRDFIRKSAVGFAGITLAQVLLPACSPARPTPPDLKVLGPVEFATLSAAADRIANGIPFPDGPDGIALLFDRNLAIGPSWLRPLFRDALNFLEFSPLLLSLPPGRFSTRTAAGRDEVLRGMANSSLTIRRQVYAAVKQAVLFTAYSDTSSWALVGYDGPGAVFRGRGRRR